MGGDTRVSVSFRHYLPLEIVTCFLGWYANPVLNSVQQDVTV